MNYNLLVEPWIPVLENNGKAHRVAIKYALAQAGRIRQIAASNPMDNVALLRFLLAVLQWCKPSLADRERNALEGADGIPNDWVNAKLGTDDQPNAALDLLGTAHRFYQDPRLLTELVKAKQNQWDNSQKKRKKQAPSNTPRPTELAEDDYRPVGDLLQEFPTETKVAHFRHVHDGQYGLCPACCAIGIVRFCTFANAYGGGRYTSAVNGPTPAYVISQGTTLLQTLLLNSPGDAAMKRKPPWLFDQTPAEADLDIVTVFAWRSRRLWLGDCGSSDEPCSYCGQPDRLIKRLAFAGNWKPPFQARGTQKKFWDQDPHLILEEVSGNKSEADDDSERTDGDKDHETKATGEGAAGKRKTVTTLGFPAPGSPAAAHARFWRRALSARLARREGQAYHATPLTISIAGPAANKGLYQDAAAILLPGVPPNASDHARDVLGLIRSATQKLIGVLRQSTPNPDAQHPNRRAALDTLSPSLEARLREEFDQWLRSPLSPTEDTSPVVDVWRDQLTVRLRRVVEAVVATATPGSPLRQREAAQWALRALDQAMDRLAKIGARQPTPHATDKRKRGRRKRGGA